MTNFGIRNDMKLFVDENIDGKVEFLLDNINSVQDMSKELLSASKLLRVLLDKINSSYDMSKDIITFKESYSSFLQSNQNQN